MGRPRMEAEELEQYRPLFENYNIKRLGLQRELAQMLKARNEAMYREVVSRVMWAKAAGYTPAEIQNSMGVSRTTQAAYQAKWREWYGDSTYEEVLGDSLGSVERGGAEAFESVPFPDYVKRAVTEVKTNDYGDPYPVHTFWGNSATVGWLDRTQAKPWFDNKFSGVPTDEIPDYALSYEREWLAKNGGQGNG